MLFFGSSNGLLANAAIRRARREYTGAAGSDHPCDRVIRFLDHHQRQQRGYCFANVTGADHADTRRWLRQKTMRGAVAALGPNKDDASARTQRGLKDLAATADLEFT